MPFGKRRRSTISNRKAKKNLSEAGCHLEEAEAVAATLKWQFINDKIEAEPKAIE